LADGAYIDTTVKVINEAGIHSCLLFPFTDQDLVNQVGLCLRDYNSTLKQEALKQTIRRQNRQLFQIANNFKKKEALNISQIEARAKQIRVLEAKLKQGNGMETVLTPPDLADIFRDNDAQFSPKGFGDQFVAIKKQILEIFKTVPAGRDLLLVPMTYQNTLFRAKQEKQYQDLVSRLIPMLLIILRDSHKSGMKLFGVDFKRYMDAHFTVSFSVNRAQAFIQVKAELPHDINATCVRYYLALHKISHGILPESKVSAWLDRAKPGLKPFTIALGKEPVYPKNSEIRYHFPTDFRHAGKVNDDGSINFRDRGEIPFVKTDAFLAAKMPGTRGTPGMDISGEEIPVQEPFDKAFEAGPGTQLSEDGLKVYATLDGQPHLDAMGRITVCPELNIEGDLGYETGDVIFEGNVVVSGTVKAGFKVKGATLTANEIEGAEIDLTGDLNVSLGIMDTELVKVKGSVQAKFIRNSKINAFGDLIVQREIVDSTIYLSGACINTSGNIINSSLSANMGIEAGNIGSDGSAPSKLTIGKDEHTLMQVSVLDGKIRVNLETGAQADAEISRLEAEEQTLHGTIAQHATVQDRSQLELKGVAEKMASLKASGNMTAFQKVKQLKNQMEMVAAKAEEDINRGFQRQDAISKEINAHKIRIETLEALNLEMQDEKNRLLEYSASKRPKPEVRIAGTIRSDTRILGPNTSMLLRTNQSRCRIVEKVPEHDDTLGMVLGEMKILGY